MITHTNTTTDCDLLSTPASNEYRSYRHECVTFYISCRDEIIDDIDNERDGWFNPRKIPINNRPKYKLFTKSIRNTLPKKIRQNETRTIQRIINN